MSLRTPLGRVRGLGSAKTGTAHFWAQRITAVALVPLIVIMIASVIYLTGSDYETARGYVAHPLVAVLLVCLLGALFHHAQLGLQVVIEDYVHVEWQKLVALLAVKFVAVVLGLTAIIAVLRIAVGS